MISRRFFLAVGALAAVIGLLGWLSALPDRQPAAVLASNGLPAVTFRLGLVPDRNISEQRQAFRALAAYLETHVRLNRRMSTEGAAPALHVELVTSTNYASILKDFHDGDVDGAFLGSLVALLAVDRCGAQVVAKSENQAGLDTYAGVLFVSENSPITSLAGLRGKKLAGVRTTMAGSIYPLFAFDRAGVDAAALPELVWCGTHDDVIDEVIAGHVDAGAVKDVRLNAYEREHAGVKFRRLGSGPRAPDNALVVGSNTPADLRDALLAALLAMRQDSQAEPVLEKLGLNGFAACELSEYAGLYDMIESLGPRWAATGIDGRAPHRPTWAGGKAGE